ncbi:REP-associated tyrosine transposase [Agriterribacter sp.]|uniref:REP-associated tyrosine transposase n=1 Tax=Agriterribacter sp. TaxID=2821509 RepID=UPI002CFCAFD8|nr:transposase [Agriterribacter sp.]HTN07941.1 transposase [Agriterribacter sp.]
MSRKYKFGDNDKLYFISFAVVYWIDLFIRNEYKEVMLESWRFCQREKDLEIYGWCIMTSHVHMIVGSKGRALDKIIGEMKSYTSRSLRKAITQHSGESRREWMLWMMRRAGIKNGNNNDWQLWQQHNKPLEILNIEMFYQKLEYIHMNPVEAGFIEKAEDYIYSSARDFYGKKGLIELCYVV